jgi:cation diffusion facilitator family transporter
MAAGHSKAIVYAAFAGNLLVALTKFIAAGWTGSSAMLSEAIHSLVDTSNQLLLLYGLYRADLPPDEGHPLGYGRELYFWSFIVALLIFTAGAGVAFYEGIQHIRSPNEIVDPHVNYVVLALSAVFEGVTWWIALRQFRQGKGDIGYFEAVRRSKDPPAFIVLFEDSAALIGIFIAFIGTLSSHVFDMPVLDGFASIGISLLLAGVAIVLARESKGLLLGEPASRRVRDSILAIARAIPGVERAQIVFTVHLAPDQIVAALALEFQDTLTTPEIEATIDALERYIHERHPEVLAIFVRPQPVETPVMLPGRFMRRSKLLSDLKRGSASSPVR